MSTVFLTAGGQNYMLRPRWVVGVNLYVATTGSDSNDGSSGSPFATLGKAIDVSAEGDTIYLAAGTYTPGTTTKTIAHPLSIIGAARSTTIIDSVHTLTLSKRFTLKNITGKVALSVSIPLGQSLDGLTIENCAFPGRSAVMGTAYGSAGILKNVNIIGNEFTDVSASDVRIINHRYGPLRDVLIKNNRFVNIQSTSELCMCLWLQGDDIDILGNYFANIAGGGSEELHAVLCYGTNIDISYNTVNVHAAGTDKEPLYMKANDSQMTHNVLVDATSNQGGLSVKSSGTWSHRNTFSYNRVKSGTVGQMALYSAGASYPNFEYNFVKLPKTAYGIGLYIYGTDGDGSVPTTPAYYRNNYADAGDHGAYYAGTRDGMFEDNTFITHQWDGTGEPLRRASWNTGGTDQNNVKLIKPLNDPTAVIGADVTSGAGPLTVTFTGTDSLDGYEIMTIDVQPATDWAVGDEITGQTSRETCVVVEKLTDTTYVVKDRSGVFTLDEVIGTVTAHGAAGGVGGLGGKGKASSITGSAVTYATGGRGGGVTDPAGAVNGTANTGNGGGGASLTGYETGGTGGSGIVVIRYVTAGITATGGTKTTDGDDTIHTFTGDGDFEVTVGSGDVEYLIVAGGGGGGSRQRAAGGGGGGGMLTGSGVAVSVGTYPVVVGAGGAGGGSGSPVAGADGEDSSALGLTATGGGGGGSSSSANLNDGRAGGSGGGGGVYSIVCVGGVGAAGPPRQGWDGGSSYYSSSTDRAGGGGGGADDSEKMANQGAAHPTFAASEQHDVTYSWDFHDGSVTSALGVVEHQFTEARTYGVTLIVTNPDGLKDMAMVPIQVDYPATV